MHRKQKKTAAVKTIAEYFQTRRDQGIVRQQNTAGVAVGAVQEENEESQIINLPSTSQVPRSEPETICLLPDRSPLRQKLSSDIEQPDKDTNQSSTENSSTEYDSDTEPSKKKRKGSLRNRQQYKRSVQLYSVTWETKLKWLSKSTKGDRYVYCSICEKHISCSGGFPDLKKHGERESHTRKGSSLNIPSMSKYVQGSTGSIRDAEIQICAWAADTNTPPKAVENFVKLSKTVFTDSKVANALTLGRTKVSAIIKNVLGETAHEEIVKLMRCNYFSLMIDESTDIATRKTLVIIVRTYVWNGATLIIRDYFYNSFELAEADAATIVHQLVRQFDLDAVPFRKNLIGFGADGANVMLGGNNSVATRLRNDCPNIFVFKCICHSFGLCASYACKKIPTEIEQMCRDIYSFLSTSPLRTSKFEQLQEIMDLKPLKMLHPAATRWLSLEDVVKRILDRFESLKIYFSFQDANVETKTVSKMKQILGVLSDPFTELYLNFLNFILPKVNQLNRLFQSESPQIYKLRAEVGRLVWTIVDNFLKADYLKTVACLESIELETENLKDDTYMGTKVQMLMETYSEKLKTDELNMFKYNIQAFYITLIEQILKRIKLSCPVLTNLAIIDPLSVKEKKHLSVYPLAKLFPNIISAEDLQSVDDEYREIINAEFPEDLDYSNGPTFWGYALSIRRHDGEFAFPFLRNIIPALLALPHSSAAVERIFSTYNMNKTKIRNRINNSTMNGLLRAKDYVKTHKNVKGFLNISDSAKRRFTSQMYKNE